MSWLAGCFRCYRFLLFIPALAFMFATAMSAHAQNDQSLYNGSWKNGWTSYSWADVKEIKEAEVDGSFADAPILAVTINKGYDALAFHHDVLFTKFYDSFSFLINGGSTGNQKLQLVACRNDVPVGSFALDPLPQNAWIRITVPLAKLNVSSVSDLTRFYIQDATGGQQSTFYVADVALKSVQQASATRISLDADQRVGLVDDRLFGLNTATWDAALTSPDTQTMLGGSASLGVDVRALRFPGGSTADDYHWASNEYASNGSVAQGVSFDDFANLVASLGAQAVVTVNYGSGTADEAAGWVAYSKKNNYPIKYWEIGNEVYGTWETDNHTTLDPSTNIVDLPHDPQTYAKYVARYMEVMKAEDSSIKVGIVLAFGNEFSSWNDNVLSALASLNAVPDFVVQHYYAQQPGAEGDQSLLFAAQLASAPQTLRGQLRQYFGEAGDTVEMQLTEINSVNRAPGKQTTSLTTALFYADTVGQLLTQQEGARYSGMYWWTVHDGVFASGNNLDADLYGWRYYGDFSITGTGDTGQTVYYPIYQAMRLLRSFARGGDAIIAATTAHPALSAYAVKRADGTLTLLVINKNKTEDIVSEVAVKGYSVRQASALSYGPSQDSALDPLSPLYGIGTGAPAAVSAFVWGPRAYCLFPAYSATVLTLSDGTPPPSTRTPSPPNTGTGPRHPSLPKRPTKGRPNGPHSPDLRLRFFDSNR